MSKVIQNRPVRVFESLQYTNVPLEGTLEDWPSHIQDTIYKALERKSKIEKIPLVIVHSSCETDYATEAGKPDRYFVRIIASEVVQKVTVQ